MRRCDLAMLALVLSLPAVTADCGARGPRELSRSLSGDAFAVLARAPAVYAPAPVPAGSAPEAEGLRAEFEAALDPATRARLQHDPALDLAAATLSESFGDQHQSASWALRQWVLWRAGSIAFHESSIGGWASRGGGRGRSSGATTRRWLTQWVDEAIKQVSASTDRNLVYGVARVTKGSTSTQEILFGRSNFETPSFQKSYAHGGPISIALKPRTPQEKLRVLVDEGDKVSEQLLEPRADGSYFLSRSAPTRPGRYFLEVQRATSKGSSLLVVPIYVGVPEPTVPDEFITSPAPAPVDSAGWAAWVAATCNGERAKLGKPPVELEPRLAVLAAETGALLAADKPAPPLDDATWARLGATGSKIDFVRIWQSVRGTDDALLRLLRPSARKRLVHEPRMQLGVAAAPHAVREDQLPISTLVIQSVLPARAAQ